jgi:hypothetical protein
MSLASDGANTKPSYAFEPDHFSRLAFRILNYVRILEIQFDNM